MKTNSEKTAEEINKQFPITPPSLSVLEATLLHEFDNLKSHTATETITFQDISAWMDLTGADREQADLMLHLDNVLNRAKRKFEEKSK